MKPDFVTTQQGVDAAFMFIFWISLLMLVGITLTMLWFLFRYHRSRAPRPTSEVDQNVPLEIVWTVIPTILVGLMFWYGWAGYLALRNVPEGAMPVTATARMWSWNFSYENGKTSDKLWVPAGRPIKVTLNSVDVLHSFYVPAFRIKRDMVPEMDNYVWFIAEKPGSYDIFCAEYCGVAHADMITTVEALPQHEFDEWYQGKERLDHRDKVRALFNRYGCLGCHSLDGSEMTGPTLQGVWNRPVVVLKNGEEQTLTADEDYLRRAILQPGADTVKGYPPVMPSYQGQISDDELHEMLEYFQLEAKSRTVEPDGAELAARQGCLGCHSEDGSKKVGPTFKGLFGSQRSVKIDGVTQTVTADRDYLRRAIRQPNAEIVTGFQPLMPASPDLTEEQMTLLLDYLESIR